MAITIRRGTYADFVPSKLQPGEFADVTEGDPNTASGRALYVCLASGNVVRVPNQEDLDAVAADAAAEASVYADSAKRSADKAEALAQPDLTIDDVISKIIDKDTADSAFGKYVIEQYTGTTLNGSAQSVANAINKMAGTSIPSNTDLNDLTVPGAYFCATSAIASTLTNCPVGTNFTMFVMKKHTNLQTQVLFASTRILFRTRTSSSWQTWYTMANMENDVEPLQEQVGALRYQYFQIPAGQSITLNINAVQAIMYATSLYIATMAEAIITTAGSGVVYVTEIFKGGDLLVIDKSVKNKLTITNNHATGSVYIRFLNFTGSRPSTLDEPETLTTTSATTTEGGE